ncbi:MAG: metalloregulator ArsR/SmtB family transcription factor, partial [Candidatus Obscuribacterales bacterium]|nr:metalloregulator ArsR/SmtB family transcription factor [Candidatus Obscuribacterales bacterium]
KYTDLRIWLHCELIKEMPRKKKQLSREVIAEDERAELVAKFFRGLGDPTRLKIIELLLENGPMSVSEIVESLGQAQGRISSHLACLRWCDFVSGKQDGRYVLYDVTDDRVIEIIALARSMLSDTASKVEACTRIYDCDK